MDERARTLLLGTGACAVLFGVILVLAYGFPAARELDAKALQGFLGLQRPAVDAFTLNMVRLGDPPAVAGIGVLLAVVAFLRGRPRVAGAVVFLIGATSVSSQLLKAVLAYPRFGGQVGRVKIQPEAFPSGHSTAVMTLAIALVMVVPARLRPLAFFVGGGLAVAEGISMIALGAHFPSDVAGGFLLATGWGLTVAAGLRIAALRWPERTMRGRIAAAVRSATELAAGLGLGALALAGALAVVIAGVLVLVKVDLVEQAREHTAAVIVGGALLVLALTLLAGFAIALRHRGQE